MKYLVIFLFFTVSLSACRNFKEPVFDRIERAGITELNLVKPVVKLQMKYFNPNKFSAKLKSAEGDAWMDSAYIGHFTVDTIVPAPANADFYIPVNLAIDTKFILQNSISLFLKPEVNIKITGTAKAGRNGFYKNFPLHYEGKQNLAELLR